MGSTRRAVLMGAAALGVAGLGTATAQASGKTGPRIGILLYQGFSLLDPTGPAEFLSRLPDATVTMLAERPGLVRTDTGDVALLAERGIDEVRSLDVLLIPGGSGKAVEAMLAKTSVLDWIRRVDRTTQWTTAVCTGTLILAETGLLKGKEATTHWAARDYLESQGSTYVAKRYVRVGKYITSAGVSAGQDLALYLASLLTDERTARAVQLGVEYDPQPPFDGGNAERATPEERAYALEVLGKSQV